MDSTSYSALILEDEHHLGKVLTVALAEEGIHAVAVTTVDSAIASLEEQRYDIVVSDIYLPEKSGSDFFRYAKEKFPDLPFIIITGNPSLESAVDFLKQGAYDYVSKPFELEPLISKIRDVIGASRKRNQERNLVNDLRRMLSQRFDELKIYQDIFESKWDGLLVLDYQGDIVRVNPGFEKMCGVCESELLNQPLSILQKYCSEQFDFDRIRQTILEKGNWKEELSASTRSSKKWIANAAIYPIANEAGETFAYWAAITDVTGLRQVEHALIDSLKGTNLAHESIIFGLAKLAEYRDPETGQHLEKMRTYCRILAEELLNHPAYENRISEKEIDVLYRTAPLHDIGKVGIPDHVLLKPSRLSEDEYEIMKTHTTIGCRTLESIREQFGETDFIKMGIEITSAHHEKYNGSGYPNNLRGDEIPLSAQIVAIADVYDALTSKRIYKRAFSHEVSINTMKMERGRHFDPKLLDIFIGIADKFNAVRQGFLE